MKIGSLCTGYGGIELGLPLAGVAVDVRWVAELDPAVAALHTMPNLGDITAVDWSAVERVDMITAGFPCQPTSSAGRQLGDADPRWLWPAVFRAVSTLLPERLLIENVRNLISYDKGRLWQGILDDLAGIGYDVRWLTLGACHVGAAHHRHRVFALATKAPILADHTATRIPTTACGAKDLLPTARAGDAANGSTYINSRGEAGGLAAMSILLPSPTASAYGSNQGGAAGRVGPSNRDCDAPARHDLLPTPQATDSQGGLKAVAEVRTHSGTDHGARLRDVAPTLLPTPAARDGAKGGGDRTQAQQIRDRNSVTLDVVVALLPSPQARDGQGRGTPSEATAAARFESGRRNLDDAMALLPTPTASERTGADSSPKEGAQNLRTAVTLLPTPRASDGAVGGPGQRGSSGDLAMPSAVQPEHWGRFGSAVERHAQHFGPPPAPTEPNRNGAPRLSPAFAEWLMCIPAGHVTNHLPRVAALKAIGNGVCPPQLAAAYRLLTGETPPMSKLSESEEIAKIKARAQAIAQTALDAYAGTPCDDEAPPDTLAGILHGIAKMWREDAIALEGSTKRGSKGRQTELRTAAGLLSAVAVDVAKLVPSDNLPDAVSVMTAGAEHATIAALVEDSGQAQGVSRNGITVPLGRAVPGSFGPGDQRPDWAVPQTQPTSVPGIDGTLIPALNIGEQVTPAREYQIGDTVTVAGMQFTKHSEWPTPEQMTADVDDGINPPPYVVTNGVATLRLDSLTTEPEKLLLAAAAAHHEQVKADAVAYISGATDVLPTTTPKVSDPVLMQIFDPEHKPAAPAMQRLRFSDLLAIQGQLPSPQHKSHSQITALENCGVKHLLGRAARHGLAPAPQLQWASVAGTAFHSTIEALERAPQHPGEPDIIQALWVSTLEATIVAEEQKSGTSRASWRVANSGLEGYDWWRVNGEQFVRAYVDFHNPEYREAKRTSIVQLGETRELAIEVPFRLDIEGIPVDGKIDQVWATWPVDADSSPTFAISDLKAGKPPFDTFQLAIYGYALSQLWAIPTERISAAFWAARKGKYETADIFALHPWDEIVYRTHAAAQREQQMPAPRVSTFCHGCEHKLSCPAGPRS